MKSFDWGQWSAIAEILSAIAILVTLVYLAIQTEQNTEAVQAATRQAMVSQDQESLYKLIEFPSLNKRTDLTSEEQTQLTAYLVAFLRLRESHWLQYNSGVLDEDTWLSYRASLVPVVFSSVFGRDVWRIQTVERHVFAQGFVDNVNEWLKDMPIEDRPINLQAPDVENE